LDNSKKRIAHHGVGQTCQDNSKKREALRDGQQAVTAQ
jgi:hypothetical protein